MSAFRFELLGTKGKLRRGRYHTPHGSFETPCFAPVGTYATLKGLTPEQVKDTGSELILANTFMIAVVNFLALLLADILYAFADPRISYD